MATLDFNVVRLKKNQTDVTYSHTYITKGTHTTYILHKQIVRLVIVFTDKTLNYDAKIEKEMTVFTPIVAVLCVVISFLAILLCVGFVTESGKISRY